MEYLSEDQLKLLLTKEWLVKSNNDSSTPYLLKFCSSTVDLTCCILITDTKSVWGEVLSSSQFARRWRDCNPQNAPSSADEDEEEAWRIKCLEFISAAHSIGGLADLTFEVVASKYSDFACTIGGNSFRWRWETFHVGPRMSADILSKHLILPLISMAHLAFSTADPLGSASETDLEKSVDKVGRTGRRTLDTHVRNTLSRPLLATTLRRITAMFNFAPDLPKIVAHANAPDLELPSPPATSPTHAISKPPPRRNASPTPIHGSIAESNTQAKPTSSAKAASTSTSKPTPQDDESVTEEEPEEDDYGATSAKGKAVMLDRRKPDTRDSSPAQPLSSKRATPDQSPPPKSRGDHMPAAPLPSSPLPVPKKVKRAPSSSSSDEDSEAERRKHLARVKGGSSRGAKQPLKRGGRRF